MSRRLIHVTATATLALATLIAGAVMSIVVPADPGGAAEPTGAFVDVDLTADESALWLTRDNGVVEVHGPGTHHGDQPPLNPDESIVELMASPDGGGYWLVSDLGNVWAYGTADDHGDVGHLTLAGGVVAAAPTTDGDGYYLLGADGGIFALGNARFHGSIPQVLGGRVLDAPIVTMSATANGYLLVAADGGTFAFGDAAFHGSIPQVLPGVQLAAGVVGMVPGPAGYLMLGADGGVFNFGESRFHGSLAGFNAADVVAATVKADLSGYVMLGQDGQVWPFGATVGVGGATMSSNGGSQYPFSSPSPVILAYEKSNGDFTVDVVDGDGVVLDRMVAPAGSVSGSFLVHAPQGVGLVIHSGIEWELEQRPASHATPWRPDVDPQIAGGGPTVLRIPPTVPGTDLVADVSAGTFITAHDLSGAVRRVMANAPATGPVTQTLPFGGGPTLLAVRSPSDWLLGLAPTVRPRSIDVTGDSVAITMQLNVPRDMRATLTVRDSAIEGCGIIGEGSMMSGGRTRRGFGVCAGFAGRWASAVAGNDPDVTVVVIGAWEVFDLWLDGRVVPFGSAEHDAILNAGLAEGIAALKATGTTVALLEVPCQFPRPGGGLTPLPERGERWRTDHLNTLMRAIAAADRDVHMLTSPPAFCDDPAIGDNPSLRWDGTHYGPAGGAFIWAHLSDQLLALPV